MGKEAQGRRATERMQTAIEKNRSKLEAYEALCSELGQEPANVALAWLLHNPAVTAPIIGPRTMEQFTGCLPAVDLQLNTIWPGPGGEAPEAYAW